MSTAPQRERSDTHKLPRGLREHMLDFHKALLPPCKVNLENLKKPLLVEVYKVLRLPRKNEPEASKVLHLPHRIIIMSQIKFNDSFTKRDFRTFQNVVQVHHILRPATKNDLERPPGALFRARLPSKTEDEGAFLLSGLSKTSRTYETTSNEHQALTPTVRTSSVATLFGEKNKHWDVTMKNGNIFWESHPVVLGWIHMFDLHIS